MAANASPKNKEVDPRFKDEDFSSYTACEKYKLEHDKCFLPWMDRLAKGKVKEDECQEVYSVYRDCLKYKLAYHGLEHLMEWESKLEDDADLDTNPFKNTETS